MTLLIRKIKLKTNSYENKIDAVPKMMLFKKYTKCIKERIPTLYQESCGIRIYNRYLIFAALLLQNVIPNRKNRGYRKSINDSFFKDCCKTKSN
jgi:hypothetical protein